MATITRRHAAIMFTDIVGYTALMGSDEDKAFDVLKKNKGIHVKYIKKYNGNLIKEMGDGMLVSFDLASDAVRCAIEIQKACKDQNIPLKIGIHEGEMVFEGSDVLGDGVNIAARIEADTSEGHISISASVYQNIRNKSDIGTKILGEKVFKNVNEPMMIYSVLLDDNSVSLGSANKRSMQQNSILVLPFENMSSDTDQEYFCEGISEDILNALTYIESIKVVARTSSFYYKNKDIDHLAIGRQIGVEYILNGSVRKVSNRMRITTKLIKVSDGLIIYSERFDRELKDLFDIQDEITGAVIEKLKLKLLRGEKNMVSIKKRDNIEVHNLYLLARHHLYKFTEIDIQKSMDYVQQIKNIDVTYGPAYVLEGGYYSLIGGAGITSIPPKIAIPEGKKAFLKAIKYEPHQPEPSAHLCFLNLVYEWDLDAAKKYIDAALELSSNHVEVIRNYAWYCTFIKDHKEALTQIHKAIEIDPCFSLVYQNAAFHYYFNRQYDKSIEYATKALEIDPYFEYARLNIGIAYVKKGIYRSAIEELKKAPTISHIADAFLGYALAKLDETVSAYNLIKDFESRMKKGIASASGVALIYLGLGEEERALEYLELASRERPAATVYTALVHLDPLWESMWRDERFVKIMNKMGFDCRN